MVTLNISSLLAFKQNTEAGQIFRRIWYYKDETQREFDRKISRKLVKGFFINDEERNEKLWVDFGKTDDWYFEDDKIFMIFNHLEAQKKKLEDCETEEEVEICRTKYRNYLTKLYSGEKRTIQKMVGTGDNRRAEVFEVLAVYKLIQV